MNQEHDIQPWYKQFWPWLLIGLPATTVVAGIAMIFIAAEQPVALVKDDYYKEGKAINQQLARDKNAAALGRTAVITVGPSLIDVQIPAKANEEQITLQFIHPLDDKKDLSFPLKRIGDNRFHAEGKVNPERWYLEIDGEVDGLAWRLKGEANLKVNNVIVLTPEGA